MHGRHLLAALLGGLLACGPLQAATIVLEAELSGANEIPSGAGDPDGTGFATVTIDTIALTVMWEITIENVADVVAAHIHIGDSTVNGAVRIDFAGQLSGGPPPTRTRCWSHRTRRAGTSTCTRYGFQAGAVRGQLHRARVPEPGTAGLLLLGLIGVAGSVDAPDPVTAGSPAPARRDRREAVATGHPLG